jgi:hypothetical protein
MPYGLGPNRLTESLATRSDSLIAYLGFAGIVVAATARN